MPSTPQISGAPIGLLGLGLMGRPVAVNLARAGHDVLAWNRRDVGLTDVEAHPAGGGVIEVAADLADLGRRCETVLSLLPDLPPLTDRLGELLGDDACVRTLVVMSTVSPTGVRDLGERLAQRGIDVVDAPMSGGTRGATDGTMSVMVGGSDEAVARVRPVLAAVSGRLEHLGGLGAGSLTKACNQLVVAATTAALAEAMVIAQEQGLDRGQVLDVLGSGLAASAVLDQKCHALATDDFTVSGPAKYLVKDLGFARDAAGDAADALPVLAASAALYADVVDAGLGEQDAAVVLEAVRRRARG